MSAETMRVNVKKISFLTTIIQGSICDNYE